MSGPATSAEKPDADAEASAALRSMTNVAIARLNWAQREARSPLRPLCDVTTGSLVDPFPDDRQYWQQVMPADDCHRFAAQLGVVFPDDLDLKEKRTMLCRIVGAD